MDFFTTFSTKFTAFLFASAILIAGCSNPASDDDDHEEHSEPDRIEFSDEDGFIASYTYSTDTTEGHFDVPEEGESQKITVEFRDEDGNEIHSEDLDDEYSLAWEIANTDHAEVEQHDEDGRWSFHIVGKAAGETTVQFMLLHGDHPDFETPGTDASNAIGINVNGQSE
ncbi:MAG: hypothetical protein ACQEST_12720 [Bacteroidota bacterium]